MSFKFQVVGEVERGEFTIGGAARKYGVQNPSTVTNWLRKFGAFDRQTQTPLVMKRTPKQTIFELEQKVKLREKQKNLLRQELELQSEKAILRHDIETIPQNLRNENRNYCVYRGSTNPCLSH